MRSLRYIGFVVVVAAAALAQSPRAFTAEDYARAEKFMPYNTTPLVLRTVRATWIAESHRFWFRNTTEQGSQFEVMDAEKNTRQPAFDHAKLAAALGAAAGAAFD